MYLCTNIVCEHDALHNNIRILQREISRRIARTDTSAPSLPLIHLIFVYRVVSPCPTDGFVSSRNAIFMNTNCG